MIKICSLDFLNRDVFDTDVMDSGGKVVYRKNDRITPDILLKLYFQEIYVEKDLCKLDEEEEMALVAQKQAQEEQEAKEAKHYQTSEYMDNSGLKQEKAKYGDSMHADEEAEAQEESNNLVFDEERAARVTKNASVLARAVKMPQDKIEELEKAAYYHNIGRSRLQESDLGKKDFRRKQASLSYGIMLNEMEFPVHVAEVAYFYLDPYVSNDFKLEDLSGMEFPYFHIVAIAAYYEEFLEKYSKEEALLKMIQLGGNKFNIFLLHRFVEIMRKTNG